MKNVLAAFLLSVSLFISPSFCLAEETSPDEAAMAQEAFVYGYPLVMNYATMYEYFIDSTSSQYKCGFNEIYNSAHVYTPADTSVVTPNSDTPYSFFCADLRAEPIIFAVPEMEAERYYSVQLVDLYTFNYGYVGSRATGNKAGKFMIAGPNWDGETPSGVDKVFHCETDFSMAIFRTQLFGPDDLENVKKIQTGYQIIPLSLYLGEPSPDSPPPVNWPKIDKQLAATNPYAYLAFVLRFCPAIGEAKSEEGLRARMQKMGVEGGKPFPCCELTGAQEVALRLGAENGLTAIREKADGVGTSINGWRVMNVQADRESYQGDWLLRAAIAMAGIYANDSIEATYPLARVDSEGNPLDGKENRYTITFPAEQLPPVNAFWSITMYDGTTQLLIKNPIDRYLINSPMLPELKKNEDGSLTLYIQKEPPAEALKANWLPAPDGPIYMVMRLYWPKTEAPSILPPGQGTWKPPVVVKAD
ncbi:DUF1254 domain-containing protein [Bremerella sp. JC817]|uniref:DUF1254 domain-containing protein n=1 Tax=Bremerella sp. JC817 TaxID=3231756 RepID=UPI003458CB1B